MREGQYKIGDVMIGNGTNYPIEGIEVTGYDTTAGDFQLPQSDEVRFGRDSIVPSNLAITMSVINNYMLDGSVNPAITPGGELLENLAREWRADEVRSIYGALKPLIYRRDDETRRIYGRPRRFAASGRSKRSGGLAVVADYQRVDTFSYSNDVFAVGTSASAPGETPVSIIRSGGKAPTWLQAFVTGPIVRPVIKFGNLFTIEIDYDLAAGKVIEINSYPWERRVIDSDGYNLRPKLVGVSPYLDQVKLPAGATIPIGLSGSGTTEATRLAALWREAYHTF